MKLFNSMGPNPHIVRMYAAELGVAFDEVEEIDLMAGDNRKPGYLQHNPAGQLPAVMLDSGEIIAEITAICEYLDEATDGKTLMGNTAAERAHTRMWTPFFEIQIPDEVQIDLRVHMHADGIHSKNTIRDYKISFKY